MTPWWRLSGATSATMAACHERLPDQALYINTVWAYVKISFTQEIALSIYIRDRLQHLVRIRNSLTLKKLAGFLKYGCAVCKISASAKCAPNCRVSGVNQIAQIMPGESDQQQILNDQAPNCRSAFLSTPRFFKNRKSKFDDQAPNCRSTFLSTQCGFPKPKIELRQIFP